MMKGHEQEPVLSERRRRWQEAVEAVEHITDKLEHPVDKGVRETVAALNIWEINTTGSCEGHDDRGELAPWIDIEAKEVAALDKELENTNDEEVSRLITEDIERKNLVERRKVIDLLDEFYRDRHVPFSRRLVIEGMARGWSKLQSQGADLQRIEPDQMRKQRLQEYQEEMCAFTDFLKEKFLDGEGAADRTPQV
jgi:hypothetical protein